MAAQRGSSRRSRRGRPSKKAILAGVLSASPALVTAQECISLEGSELCQAFQGASFAKTTLLTGFYPFLNRVTDAASFDEQLATYVRTDYVREKYQIRFGCDNIDLGNTSELYARFTTTVICNSIVQNSVQECELSAEDSQPVCADTCAEFAQSVAFVSADPDLCAGPNEGVMDLIRGEFTTCALPDESLSSPNCIRGIENEPLNCGYGNSLIGLCSYCASGGLNSTDTCCYTSEAEERCEGVELPSVFPTVTFTEPTTSATSSPEPVDDDDEGGGGLSGGAIAGIVVGSIAALVLLGLLLFFCLRHRRQRGGSQKGSSLNQPSPPRTGHSMSHNRQVAPPGFEVLPGGRIARMSALEGHSGEAPSRNGGHIPGGAAAAGAVAGYAASRRRGDNHSSSDEYGDSPESDTRAGVLRPPPAVVRRAGSVSSNSQLEPQSPTSAGGMSSPQGMASQQSEQLPFFKDYYSSDDIHPGDRVAVLWAYQPRAADEFALERSDMLKVVGIWDDGWATGIMLDERAEEWEVRRQAQRDSGVSNTSGRRDTSPPVSGEIKAFPLVCVCLPEHWRKTIEGDGSTETGSSNHHGAHSTMS